MSKRPAEDRSWGAEAEQARRDLHDAIDRLKREVSEHRRRLAREGKRDDTDEGDGRHA